MLSDFSLCISRPDPFIEGGKMRLNRSVNSDTQLQEAASRRLLRAGHLQR